MKTIDEGLLEFATEVETKYLNAIIEHGSGRKAAKALGVNTATINRAIARLKIRAAVRGYSPEHNYIHAVPATHIAKGVSTCYDADGNIKQQWVKSAIDREAQLEVMREAIAGLVEEVPRVKPTSPTTEASQVPHLLNLYTMTDCHMGQLSWPKETGEAWDLKIAEATLWGGFKAMIDASPHAGTAIVNQLGDFLHSDGMLPVTPMSGHILDQDVRFPKIVAATIRILRKMISYALQKHEHVHVIMAEGNHDMSSSIWLRQLFTVLFENEPRVTVDDSECPYYVYQFGKVMLGFHHGHKKNINQLPLLYAAQFSDIWGATDHRYIHTGHLHHVDIKDHNGVRVQQHATLAARDAYSSRGGWVSPREATAITYHIKYGQVGTYTVTPDMLSE